MSYRKKIVILKLGGGLLTDKSKPFFIREDIAQSTVQQIIKANEKLILVHGGGSFGHPLAMKYKISQGLNASVPNQILGLTETHQAMVKFNSFLTNLFLEREYPAFSVQSSSIFFQESQKISTHSVNIIEAALDLNILPILYGDIILDDKGSFSIMSGDQLIFKLCEKLQNYNVTKVIFATETDGIFLEVIEDGKEIIKLAPIINVNELESLNLASLGQKIDVTGGIEGKINSIKKICKFNIPVQLINGLKEGYVFKSLKNKELNCTNIVINKNQHE